MTKGAPEEPFDRPVYWDLDTCLWDLVVEQGLSGRKPHQELVALKDEILTKTRPESQLMRDFWAALSLCLAVISRLDGLHLGQRRLGDGVAGGTSLTVEQVKALRACLWDRTEPRHCRDALGDEVTSLNAESAVIETLCMKTGIRLMYKTLGPASWDLVLA